jgi:hypothetical protein
MGHRARSYLDAYRPRLCGTLALGVVRTLGFPLKTQEFVPIKEVRDGVVVLKDGGLRAVLMASSINLSLKSADEQEAILLQFQNFLNSLDFSTQILVQSRRLDIRPYLLQLDNRLKEQLEPLLKVQTKEYIDFIRGFTVKGSNISKI